MTGIRDRLETREDRPSILKAKPLRSWLKEREPLIGSRDKLLFGIPRTSPDPLPAGVTPQQAVEAVESTSWAKGLAEGVCAATGLTGESLEICVTNYKRKVALGALGLTAAQLTGEAPIRKKRGPGRLPATPAAPVAEERSKKFAKTETSQEHWTSGRKRGDWISDIHVELGRGNQVFFTGPPDKSGTKLLVVEKDSGKSFVSRPLSIQELDFLSRAAQKGDIQMGIYGSPPPEGTRKA